MRNNYVLIDFESVQPESMEVLNHECFHVLLFCGANQTKVPFALASSLQSFGSRAQYIKIAGSGPNALDFHIAYYIGRLAVADAGAFFHIISRDKGFDPLIQHLKDQKIFALRSEAIADIPIAKHSVPRTPAERAEIFIAKLRDPKVTRPRSEKTMSHAIMAHFRPAIIDDSEVASVLSAMADTGFLSIKESKIVYAQPNP
jgi:hypothetical protein